MEENKETAITLVEQNYCPGNRTLYSRIYFLQFHQSNMTTDHVINNHLLNETQFSVTDMSFRFKLLTKYAAYSAATERNKKWRG